MSSRMVTRYKKREKRNHRSVSLGKGVPIGIVELIIKYVVCRSGIGCSDSSDSVSVPVCLTYTGGIRRQLMLSWQLAHAIPNSHSEDGTISQR